MFLRGVQLVLRSGVLTRFDFDEVNVALMTSKILRSDLKVSGKILV